MCRRDATGHTSSYYDGGDFSPYCIESLVELLRGETHTAYQSLNLTLEIKGSCGNATVREIARRFSTIHAPKIRVRICARGQQPVVIATGLGPHASSPKVETAGTAKHQ